MDKYLLKKLEAEINILKTKPMTLENICNITICRKQIENIQAIIDSDKYNDEYEII